MLKRITAFALAALLVVGGIYLTPAEAKAEGNEKTFTFAELTKAAEWGVKSEISADGVLDISFEGQYQSQFYNIPSEIGATSITGVKFDVASGNEADLAFKLHTQEDYDSDNKGGTPVSYGSASVTATAGLEVKYISIMSLNSGTTKATINSVTFYYGEGGAAGALTSTASGENLLVNGDFSDADVSAWEPNKGEAVISTQTAQEPIVGDLVTYGAITGRTSPYDCFSQDVTDKVENGKVYNYEFFVKLSDAYEGAPADQRQVDFAPYVTADGSTTYLGSYSAEISGASSQQLNPGEWTRFAGTFKVYGSGTIEQVVIRIIEQGTNYGEGDCVLGDYYVTGVSLSEAVMEKKEIEKDVPNLKDAFTEDFGEDMIAGVSVVASEMSDELLMQLVTKHFNAITIGNELKPDALFNYSNAKCPGTTTAELNGETITVPVLDYSRAEKILDTILAWNEANPEDQIKVRGHVLVWHSQTPEWFFHEDYDKTKPYVSKEEMNKRLEWFIKTVLEHFTAEDSKYYNMFYGWDVVNEAVSDSTGTYRSDTEGGSDNLTDDTHGSKSSWWKVYQSNEFIINAFRYANKYAPASVELYYNDYNECTPSKVGPIVELLKAVKEAEGTRIDGMGMQGHYGIDSPTINQFIDAAKTYSEVVDSVALTELDIKASSRFDGTSATLADEYTRQAYVYKALYDNMLSLKSEGVNFTGMTVWGVIDGNSWLQTSNSVGGAADGTQSQCPLLFDDNYKVKPSFWAMVDPDKLEPSIESITVLQNDGVDFEAGYSYSLAGNDVEATFIPSWNDKELTVVVDVKDATEDDTDAVSVYLDEANSRSEGITPLVAMVARKDAEKTDGGYKAVVKVPCSAELLKVSASFAMDVVVTNADKAVAFNDSKLTFDTSSKYYADALVKPYISIPKGTPAIDGETEDAWNEAVEVPLSIVVGNVAVTSNMKLLWDDTNLYVYADVKDAVLNKDNEEVHQQDSIEVFIDELNGKEESYGAAHKQYRINYENAHSFNGEKCLEENMKSAVKLTDDGYIVEASFAWTELKPEIGKQIGLELQVNDADATAARTGTLSWFDETGSGWSNPSVFGTAMLVEKLNAQAEEKEDSAKGVGTTVAVVAALLCSGSALVIVNQKKKKSEESEKKEEK